MARKPETLFRERLRKRLDKIPNAWFESIQQVGINGTPDLMGCIGPFFVAIEVKTDDGVSSPLQTYKRSMILNAGSIALVIAPSNMEEMLVVLENLSKKCSNKKHDKRNPIKKGSTDDKT